MKTKPKIVCFCLLASFACVALAKENTFEVTVAEDANNDNPVAVDVVVVHTEKAEEAIKAQTAAAWFNGGRPQAPLQGDIYRGLSIRSFEWVPGQHVGPFRLRYRRGARAVYVFADYFSPGDHRQKVRPSKKLVLYLGATDFKLTEN